MIAIVRIMVGVTLVGITGCVLALGLTLGSIGLSRFVLDRVPMGIVR